MIEKTLRINALFDFYKDLLTEKQRDYMYDYYDEDLSLGEIAEGYGVSRQAVYDNIKRTEMILEDYESKLHLLEQFELRQSLIEKIKTAIGTKDQSLEQLVLQLEKMDESSE